MGFWASAIKGTLSVLLFTPLIYWLVRRDFQRVGRATDLLRAVADGTTDAVFVKDREGKYLLFNEAAARFVGMPVADVLGKDDTALFDAESARVLIERDRQIMAAERAETAEEVLTAAGQTRTYLATKAPYRDADGNVIGVIGISRDITEWKLAQTMLREQEAFARGVLNSMTAHVAVIDSTGRIIAINEPWRLFAEQNPQAVGPAPRTGIGTNYLDVCDHSVAQGCDEAAVAVAGIRGVIAGATDQFSFEYPCHSPTVRRWFLMSATRLGHHSGGVVVAHTNITDRREVEESLREERSRLTQIAATAPGVIFSCRIRPNGETTFPYVSPGITDIYRVAPEELALDGSSILASVHPEDAVRFRASIEQSARTLSVWHETYRVCLPEGRECWIEGRATPAREPDGGTLWHGFLMEVTDRKRDEAVLLFQHALLQSQTEASPDGILVVGHDNRILSYNRRFLDVWDMPAELLAAGDDAPVLALARSRTADPDAFSARVASIYAEPDTQSCDEVALADGRTLDRSSGSIRGTDGEILGRVWYFRDITDRKRGERELDRQHRELQLILDAVPALIFYKDLDHRLIRVNEELVRVVGIPRADIEGRTDAELGSLHAEQYARDEDEVVATGQPKRGLLEPLTTATGERWLQTDKLPYRNESGRIVGVIGFAVDITERKRAEEDRQKFVALADSSQEFIGMCDQDFNPFYVNAAGQRLVGLESLEAACRVQVQDFFFPEDRPFIADEFFPRVQREGNASVEIRFRHFQRGDAIWMDYNVFPLRDATGEVLGWATVSRNIHARKLAEQALRDRERLLGIVTGSARVGLVVVSDAYEYLFANEAYAEIFGLDAHAVVGRRVPELLAAAWAQIQPRLDRALAGERVAYELSLPPAQDAPAPRWFRVVYEPRADDTDMGRPTVVVVVLEITEQKQSEVVIRESEARYRLLMDILPDAVFVHEGGVIVFCNPAFVRLLGANSADELLGKSPFDLLHPDYHSVVRARIAKMNETGEVAPSVEVRVVRCDGRVVPAHSIATPIRGPGSPILVVLSDLTEREWSMDLLRSVLRSVNDSILTVDDRGTIQSANAATERMFGYAESDLVGRNVNKLMPEPYRDEHDGYIANYLRTDEAKVIGIGRQVAGRRKDGTTFPIELTVTEFRLDGARRFTGVIRDITARKQLEEQFQQAQKMESVGRLAGGVAHDFNNLLTVINGYSDLILLALPATDPQRELVASIRDAGERAARVTGQLLAFSRKAIVVPKVIDLNELVAASAKLLSRLIGEDISLVVVPDPSLTRIKIDPGQLEQVIMNLVVNARDAMPTGGRVLIQSYNVNLGAGDLTSYPGLKPGRYARLTVTDTGMGMTDEVKSKIFEPFFTTKGLGKGTGLGLAVVHGVVEQCGGHIEVDSTVGVGTTFTLLFPGAVEVEEVTREVAGTGTRGTETVLLVEDEDAVRAIARIALETQGFTVLEARRGVDAIRVVEEHAGTIHLLVTDVVMPEMSGRQLAEILQGRCLGLRVLYMSGYTDDSVIHHGVVVASDAFLQKPFTPLGLARKVRAVLDGTA